MMETPWRRFPRLPFGQVLVVPSASAAAEVVYGELLHLLSREPEPHLGLATGSTFEPLWDRLVQAENAGQVDLRHATLTHLDEYEGLAPDQPGSMVHELTSRFLGRLRRGVCRFHAVPSAGPDPVRAHQSQVRQLPPPHIQLLGIGRNGHVAFNEPGTPFAPVSVRARLTESTLEANRNRFPAGGGAPTHAISLGIRGILAAQRLILVATGKSKAGAVADALNGPIGEHCPASAVRLHPNVLVILDSEAAAELPAGFGAAPSVPAPQVFRGEDLKPPGPVVVISPHPDDASISCGGLLTALPPGTRRVIVTMTTGARAHVAGAQGPEAVTAWREAEAQEEARILGSEAVFLRGKHYDSGMFEENDVRRLMEILAPLTAAWVLAPSLADPHPTHRLSRQILDEAVRRLLLVGRGPTEVWTFEGPWFQHPRESVNALVLFDESHERVKLAAVRAHRSQLDRVPFDAGSAALARLRPVSFGESLLGGTEPGRFPVGALAEAYRRELTAP